MGVGCPDKSHRSSSLKQHDLNGHLESFTSPAGLLLLHLHDFFLFATEISDSGLATNPYQGSKGLRTMHPPFLFGPVRSELNGQTLKPLAQGLDIHLVLSSLELGSPFSPLQSS